MSAMKLATPPVLALIAALSLSQVACDKADDSAKDDKAKADEGKADEGKADEGAPAAEDGAPAADGEPKEGDSCEGISASDGLIACDGNTIIFCSSYSDYKWTKQQECAEGTKCVAEGKGAGCK